MMFKNFIAIFLTCYLSIENINCEIRSISVPIKEKMYYRIEGTGAHTLLLIDGTLGDIDAENFSNIYNNFDLNVFKIIQIDLPGYGHNQFKMRKYNDNTFFALDAQALINTMIELGIEKYSVAGWGYGGSVALVLAGMVPDQIIKVVEWGAKPFITDDIIEQSYGRSLIQDWNTSELNKQLINHTQEYIVQCHKNLTEGFKLLKEKGNSETNDTISKIQSPTMLLHGSDDKYVDICQPIAINKLIPSAKLVTILEACHSVHENSKFVEVVQEFLLSDDYPHENNRVI